VSPFSHLHAGAHIVCADEDPRLLDFIVATLRKAEYCAFQAYDGLAALELVLALRVVDLLITNTKMPGLTGPKLIRQVREQFPDLPILYIRNHDAPGGVPDGLPANVPILHEPFTAEQLIEEVSELLGKNA
jgi:two-component system cell cycle sensor histidine kinase/response regulator CckA